MSNYPHLHRVLFQRNRWTLTSDWWEQTLKISGNWTLCSYKSRHQYEDLWGGTARWCIPGQMNRRWKVPVGDVWISMCESGFFLRKASQSWPKFRRSADAWERVAPWAISLARNIVLRLTENPCRATTRCNNALTLAPGLTLSDSSTAGRAATCFDVTTGQVGRQSMLCWNTERLLSTHQTPWLDLARPLPTTTFHWQHTSEHTTTRRLLPDDCRCCDTYRRGKQIREGVRGGMWSTKFCFVSFTIVMYRLISLCIVIYRYIAFFIFMYRVISLPSVM